MSGEAAAPIGSRPVLSQVAAAPLGREAAEPASLSGGDPEWLKTLRRSAAASYREAPWPSSARDEDWRRTQQIDRLDPAAFSDAPADGGEASAALTSSILPGADFATVLAGAFGDRSEGGAGSEEEVLLPLSQALSQPGSKAAESSLGRIAPPGLRKLVALNTVRFTGGGLVRVPRGRALSAPLQVVSWVGSGQAVFPRVLIELEEGASATVVEQWLSPSDQVGLLAPVTEIRLGAGSRLTHVVLQRCGAKTVIQSTARAELARDSSYQLRFAMLGGAWQKSYFDVLMAGLGSEAKLNGLFIGRDSQHADIQTLQDHIAGTAISDLLYRAAVAERARSVYSGLIRVEEGAQKTNAYVQNRNLLLGPRAKADSNPTLEILANDVRCTHGSTAGRVDSDQLFYCQSRGIPADQARRLVVEGFFADVLDSFPEGSIRQGAADAVLSKLEELQASGALSGGS